MRSRVGAALLFVSGGVLAIAAAYAVSEAVDPVYPELRAKVSLLRTRGAELNALTVGDSHSQAIEFDALGMRGMHFWEPGQDALEADYMARFAAARVPELRLVLLAASYELHRFDHAVVTSENATDLRRQMYARAPALRYIPGDRDLWMSSHFAALARADHWRGVLAHLGDPAPPVRLTRDGKLPEAAPPVLSRDSLARFGIRRAEEHRRGAEESARNDPATPARIAARLEGLARELGRRDVALVLYTPPYHETYLRHAPRDAVEEMRVALEPVLRLPNVLWLDFGTHPSFTGRDDLFRNSDHLNPAGARAFSTLLGRCLHALPETAPGCRRVAPPVPSPASTAAAEAAGPSRGQKETAG